MKKRKVRKKTIAPRIASSSRKKTRITKRKLKHRNGTIAAGL